jgi:hypothetical protein
MKMSSFNSYYGCDNCTNQGVLYKPTLESRGWVTFPASTRHNFELRTKEQTLEQASIEDALPRQRLGVAGRSLLFDLEVYTTYFICSFNCSISNAMPLYEFNDYFQTSRILTQLNNSNQRQCTWHTSEL